jgi:hypothetical protein
MAIIPANMDNCDPKRKCLWGDNEDIAYTLGAACPPNETFSEELCDCEGFFFCDCNCHNDCADCELCIGGFCRPDPDCAVCQKVSEGGYGFLLMDNVDTGQNVGFLSNDVIEITRNEYGPDPERPGKIAFFLEWLDIGNVPDSATFGNKDSEDYVAYIDVQEGECEA